MLRSLFSAVSGLNANQEYIDAIGNDIANVNTTGYKSTEVQFDDLLSQNIQGATAPTSDLGGMNPVQVGLGVQVAGIEANMTQGTNEQTGNPLDLAVQGNGFFIANDSGQTVYTQAGSLDLDANGDLVTPSGALVQGWAADSQGNINTSNPLTNLTIPTDQQIPANATQNVTLGGNLAGESGWTAPAAGPGSGTNASSTGASTSATVYTQSGASQSLDLNLEQDSTLPSGAPKGAVTAWTVEGALTDPGSTADYTNSTTATLYFSASGSLVGVTDQKGNTATGTSLSLTVPDETSGAASGATQSFTLDLSSVTANANSNSLAVTAQDGYPPGSLESYSIGSTGIIQGVFSNGHTMNLGQIALATFSNPDGLERAGDTDFMQTANSGLAQVGVPGSGSTGTISAGTLEASNVNLASEMTELIEAERGFQANGTVITTSDTLLQDLINLKQSG